MRHLIIVHGVEFSVTVENDFTNITHYQKINLSLPHETFPSMSQSVSQQILAHAEKSKLILEKHLAEIEKEINT